MAGGAHNQKRRCRTSLSLQKILFNVLSFPLKGQIGNILGFAGYKVSVVSIQLYCYTVKAALGNMKSNRHSCVLIKLYLKKQTAVRIWFMGCLFSNLWPRPMVSKGSGSQFYMSIQWMWLKILVHQLTCKNPLIFTYTHYPDWHWLYRSWSVCWMVTCHIC